MITTTAKTATKPAKTQTKTGKYRFDRQLKPARPEKRPLGVTEMYRTLRQYFYPDK